MDQDEKLIEDIKKLLGDDPTDEDPYEKGFADKLYEDEDNQPATIRSSMHGHWLTVHFFFLL